MKNIIKELKHHAPFTFFGAIAGIVFMFIFRGIKYETAHQIFYVFHPLHVVLSAIVTTAMYKVHQCGGNKKKCSIVPLILIGYVGSIGIATLSDSLIPFIGEKLLNFPQAEAHIGFIEEWYIINPAAFLGIAIGYFWTNTKFPHAGHVLISTWASLFHMIMAVGGIATIMQYFSISIFLFLSVWLPCCVSDIVFPLLFVKKKG
ncbi:MAG: hypothetical protein HQL29_06165 [Candidatus Omnitrophica bacterium]|nr:hypothetical protein [Candidatus Omnitrophota bacterium]